MKAFRFIFSEISQNFPIMPFSARAVHSYPVLHEKPGDFVAHIKFTVLLMSNGSDRITPHTLQELQPTKTLDEEPEIKARLALGTKSNKKGGRKKRKGKKGGINVSFNCE